MLIKRELIQYMLYSVYNSGSPMAFIEFLLAMYEIPKRIVEYSADEFSGKKMRERFDLYNLKHGIKAKGVAQVRDAYVHRLLFIGDLRDAIFDLRSSEVMSYVRYFRLDIPEVEIADKRLLQLLYLEHLCGIFSHVRVSAGERSTDKQWKANMAIKRRLLWEVEDINIDTVSIESHKDVLLRMTTDMNITELYTDEWSAWKLSTTPVLMVPVLDSSRCESMERAIEFELNKHLGRKDVFVVKAVAVNEMPENKHLLICDGRWVFRQGFIL